MQETQVGKIPWRRAWQSTPVFLPGEFRGQGSLVGCSPWNRKESDTTELVNDNNPVSSIGHRRAGEDGGGEVRGTCRANKESG